MIKNLFALFLGLCLAVALVGGLEFFFRLNQNHHWLRPPPLTYPDSSSLRDIPLSQKIYETLKDSPAYKWTPLISNEEGEKIRDQGVDRSQKGHLPCCAGRLFNFENMDFHSREYSLDHRLLYDAHFTTDATGRRTTPARDKSDYNILMFGDSYTMGEAVNDEEAAPYQLALMRPRAQVYNLGLSGGSINEVLYELSTLPAPRLEGIKKQKTFVLYTYMDHHLERLFCRSLCLNSDNNWIMMKPYYVRSGGKIQLRGFFDTDREFVNTLYRWIDSSALLSFFQVVWPLRFTQNDYDFFADMLVEIRDQAKKKFGDVDFYFVLYPGASDLYGRFLKEAAEKRGVSVLDYSPVEGKTATGHKDIVPGDGHPSPVLQYVFAYLLNRDLPKPLPPPK